MEERVYVHLIKCSRIYTLRVDNHEDVITDIIILPVAVLS